METNNPVQWFYTDDKALGNDRAVAIVCHRPEDQMGKSLKSASLAALAVAMATVSLPAMAQDQDHDHRGGGDRGSQQQGDGHRGGGDRGPQGEDHRGNGGGNGGGQRQSPPPTAQVHVNQGPAGQPGGPQQGRRGPEAGGQPQGQQFEGRRGPGAGGSQQGQWDGHRGPGGPQQAQQPNGQNPWANRGGDDRRGGPGGPGRDGRGPDGRGPDGRGPDGRGPGGRGDDQARRAWEAQQHQPGGPYHGQGRDHYGYQGQRPGQNWSRDWRHDNRYDWNRYRNGNRDSYRLSRYNSPYRNWGYRRLNVGFFLQPLFYSNSYWIGDPYDYRLPPAYGPYRWVRYYNDALLVNIYNGEVVDTVYDIFW